MSRFCVTAFSPMPKFAKPQSIGRSLLDVEKDSGGDTDCQGEGLKCRVMPVAESTHMTRKLIGVQQGE